MEGVPDTGNPNELRDWLSDHGLSSIYDGLLSLEFETTKDIQNLPQKDWNTLAEELGLKFGKFVTQFYE